jgi:hypothetical protein
VLQIITDAILNSIPLIVIKCDLGCGNCKNAYKQTFTSNNFLTELNKKNCSILYIPNVGYFPKKLDDVILPNGTTMSLGPTPDHGGVLYKGSGLKFFQYKLECDSSGNLTKIYLPKEYLENNFIISKNLDQLGRTTMIHTNIASTPFVDVSKTHLTLGFDVYRMWNTLPTITYVYKNQYNELLTPGYHSISSNDLIKLINGEKIIKTKEIAEVVFHETIIPKTSVTTTLEMYQLKSTLPKQDENKKYMGIIINNIEYLLSVE